MMKRILLLATFLLAVCAISFAQDKPLTGVWELKKTKDGQGNIQDVPSETYLKAFTNEDNFFNMRITDNGEEVTHEGIFRLEDNNKYIEIVKDKISGSYIDENQTSLTYKLSEDGNTLILEGELKLGNGNYTYNLYEEWKRINIEINKNPHN